MSELPAEEFGPAMMALTELQRRFVMYWIGNNGKDAAEAARAAGYSDSGDACKVRAHAQLHNPKVIAALREEADRHLGILPILAVLGLKKDLASAKQSVRERAQESVLDRTGYGRKTTQDIRVEHVDKRSTAEILAEVRRLMPPGAMPVIEGEVLEVGGDDNSVP